MSKPLFSIVAISRNESKTLPHLIASLKEFQSRGGEICIVDTGSTDGTPDVARSLGCVVKEVGTKYVHTIGGDYAKKINERFIVENEISVVSGGQTYFDFAAARNDVVSIASNDWVCTVDCDEQLTRLDIDGINKIISSDPELAHFEYNFVFSHDQFGAELIKFVQSKFYNRKRMEWKGIIHEMLSPIIGGNRFFLGEELFKLEHWQNPETNRRGYLVGLAVDCYEHQEKDRNSHYFAREMWWNGRPWSAAKEFKRHIEMKAWPAERAESMLYLSRIYGAMEHPEEQIEWIHKAAALTPERREPIFELAQVYARRGNWQEAKAYAKAAMEIPWNGWYGSSMSQYTNEPHEILYRACGWTGDIPGAREHLLKCLEFQRENYEYLRDTQFYFDYPANFIAGWFSYPEQLFVYENAKKMESWVELGSWKGKSTHAAASSGCPKVIAIDHFEGSLAEPDAHAQAKDGSVYEEYKKNVGHFKNLKTMKMSFDEAVKEFPDHSVDAVFIDGGHTEDEVRNDIRKWKNKARILLCGHDYCSAWGGVTKAVDEELGGPDEVHDSVWVKWLVRPKVSICIPTLGRPEKLHRLLEKIKENAEYDNYEIIVEEDKPIPNNEGCPTVLKRCVDRSTGDFVMFLGNDVIPQPNFLQEAIWQMIRAFPEMDGFVALNDGYWEEGDAATHWLASKKLLPMLGGEFFHTGYYHTGCDNELMARCEMLGKYTWAKNAKIIHDHPINSGFVEGVDEIYAQSYSGPRHDHDNELYEKRSKEFGFNKRVWRSMRKIPKIIWSIWLNDNKEIPELVKKCLASRNIEGYEHRLITLENCFRNKYVNECLSRNDVKGWAKAADYLRGVYLYYEGGIYLDADTEVLKPFDDLLSNELFACKEDNGFVANGIIGAIPFHPSMMEYITQMDKLSGSDDKVFENGMEVWTPIAYRAEADGHAKIYPQEYFLPYNHQTNKVNVTPNTHTYHNLTQRN